MSLQIEIDRISFGYESSSLLFEEFSFSVVGGGSVALVGESGSGKSTLLNLIAGLEIPNSGSIKVFNTRLDTLSSAELNIYRRDRLGFIFQTFHLIPHLTVLQNIMVPGLLTDNSFSNIEKKAIELLRVLRLDKRKGALPANLSGGEKQRACIARALMNDPSIILADEPTGNLDQLNTTTVIDSLLDRCKLRNVTLIIATHSPTIADKMDTSITISNQRIVPV